jgi:hypothetical protein
MCTCSHWLLLCFFQVNKPPRQTLLLCALFYRCSVQSLQSHYIHTHHVSLVQWTTRFLPVMRDPGSSPRGLLMWNRDSPVNIVSLHWWPWCDWSLWPRLGRASSRTVTRPLCWHCDNPTWSHAALLSWFHARCRSSFRLHNQHSQLLGGALCRACNLTAFTHHVSLVQCTTHLLPVMRDWGSIPRGVLMWN